MSSQKISQFYIKENKLVGYISPKKVESWETSIPGFTKKEAYVKNLATEAKLVKEEELIYSVFGEIAWGDGVNSTFIVFDLSTDKIYIWHNLESDSSIYSPDKNFPKVFKEWIK